MSLGEMQTVIIDKYGPVIRGKKVVNMPERQIYAIYRSLMEREEKANREKEAAKSQNEVYCGSCAWFNNNKCAIHNVSITKDSPACRTGYSNIKADFHQMSIFETSNE